MYSKFIFFCVVHPCDRGDNAGCDQTCTKKGDEAVCECGPGFILNNDGKKCDPSKSISICYRNFSLKYTVFHFIIKKYKIKPKVHV